MYLSLYSERLIHGTDISIAYLKSLSLTIELEVQPSEDYNHLIDTSIPQKPVV